MQNDENVSQRHSLRRGCQKAVISAGQQFSNVKYVCTDAGKRSIPVGTLAWNIPMILGLRIGAEGCCGFVEGRVWV